MTQAEKATEKRDARRPHTVNIRPAAMSCETFKKVFYDNIAKEQIPHLLKCLSHGDRKVFEAYLAQLPEHCDITERNVGGLSSDTK